MNIKLIDSIVEPDCFSVFISNEINVLDQVELQLKARNIHVLREISTITDVYDFSQHIAINKLTGVYLFNGSNLTIEDFYKGQWASTWATIWMAFKITMLKGNTLYIAKDRFGATPYTEVIE